MESPAQRIGPLQTISGSCSRSKSSNRQVDYRREWDLYKRRRLFFPEPVIYLIEKYFDRQTAIYCAKVFQIEIDRQSQSAFTIFTGQKQHSDEIVKKAQAYIETNAQEKISFDYLSSAFAVGRRNFDRRFIKATGNTPLEYSQRVKIESAKKALETSRKTVNEVMYEVGYSDVKAFREVFRKITGMSPLEYRNKYNKEAVV
jgi:transcriptional regulator GlxA family with amidase domain